MSVHPRFWLVLAPLGCFSNAQAQQTGGSPALAPPVSQAPATSPVSPSLDSEPQTSLADLVRLALRRNPQLSVARENLEAARGRAAAARATPGPTLQGVPRILGDRDAADAEIIVSQSLDAFGKRRAQAQVLAAQARGAQAQSALAENALIGEVKNACAALFAAQEAEKLSFSQVEIARSFRQAAARRASVGDVPAVQVQRAELELARSENELDAARAERGERRAVLNELVGRAPETPLWVALPLATEFVAAPQTPADASTTLLAPDAAASLPSASDFGATLPGATPGDGLISDVAGPTRTDLAAQRAALLPAALARPDIRGAQAALEAGQAQVRALGRQRYPDVELQVRRGSFPGQGATATALRAVITVPLFDFGSIEREKKAAQAEVRGQQAQIEWLRQQAATQVEQALIRLGQQRQTVARYRQVIVPQTLDLLRKTQLGYAQGASTYLEVLEAQRTWRQVQTEYLQALVGTRTGETALESALGAPLSARVFGPPLSASIATALPDGALPDGAPGTAANASVASEALPPAPPTSSASRADTPR